MTGASGDRWVVRYPGGDWGVERSSRRVSVQLFLTMEEALDAARDEARAAGGGDILIQSPDGELSLRDQVVVAGCADHAPRRPEPVTERAAVARTVLA